MSNILLCSDVFFHSKKFIYSIYEGKHNIFTMIKCHCFYIHFIFKHEINYLFIKSQIFVKKNNFFFKYSYNTRAGSSLETNR